MNIYPYDVYGVLRKYRFGVERCKWQAKAHRAQIVECILQEIKEEDIARYFKHGFCSSVL